MNKFQLFKHKKILITGHTGFKGSWLSIWLSHLGAEVYGISDIVPTTPSNFETYANNNIIIDHRINILDVNLLKKKIIEIQPDFLFHLAAQPLVKKSYSDPLNTWQTNTIGTVNVLNSLRYLKNKCVAIFITSDKCYDNVEWEWGYRENDKLGGPDPYSASKAGAELAVSSFIRSYSFNEVKIGIGRAGNVIGGGDWAEDRIVPDCIKCWSRNEIVELRNPSSTRPWQHVLEPLSGYLDLAFNLYHSDVLNGHAFNFGPLLTKNYSVLDLVSEMSKYWENVRWDNKSENLESVYESKLLKLNCDKALFHLGWMPNWNFEKTVKETVEWYKYFYIGKSNIYDFSISQIENYMLTANENNIKWAI